MHGRISAVRPVRGLRGPVRIGDQRPSDDDPVAVAAPDRRLGDGRPLDAADREHRHRQPALQERRNLDVRGLGVVEQRDRVGHRAVDARRDDERVRAGRGEHLRRGERVRRPDPSRRDVVAVQPHDEREPGRLARGSAPRPRPRSGRARRSCRRRRRPSRRLLAGGEELVHEIAVAGVQLDGVESRLGGAGGRSPEGRTTASTSSSVSSCGGSFTCTGGGDRRGRHRLDAGHHGDT